MLIHKIVRAANIRLYPQHLFHAPSWLVLGVNNLCNLHCKMCDVGTGYNESNFFFHLMGAKPLNMPKELIEKALDQVAEYFPKTKIGYGFTEPLIYPHLLDSLKYAKERKLHVAVTSNGLKLKKMWQELVELELDELFISLDGPPAIHNEIRGNKTSFEWAYEGIENILAHPKNKTKIGVYCTITEWNIGYLQEFLAYFRKLPLLQIGFMHTNFTTDGMAALHNQTWGTAYPASQSNLEGIVLENMDLDALWAEMQEIKKQTYSFPVSFSPEINSREDLQRFYFEPEKPWGKRCGDVFSNLMLKSDGTVIPAHGRCYKVEAGNLYQNNLKEIWNAPTLAQFRKDLGKAEGLMPACYRCCSSFG